MHRNFCECFAIDSMTLLVVYCGCSSIPNRVYELRLPLKSARRIMSTFCDVGFRAWGITKVTGSTNEVEMKCAVNVESI